MSKLIHECTYVSKPSVRRLVLGESDKYVQEHVTLRLIEMFLFNRILIVK